MKPKFIRVCSDLHLEQYTGREIKSLVDTFLPADERDVESVLVLAGDISSKLPQLVPFLKEVEKRFTRVYFVPGNHEFYGHAMDKWAAEFQLAMGDSTITEFATLDMCYEELEGVRFIFGTFWADGGATLQERADVGRYLRDFFVIRWTSQERWTVPRMAEAHKKQKAQLEKFLEQPFEGKTVVVSHHMPSYRLCHPRFGNAANGGFASNCDLILATDKVDAWIFGHTHDTIDMNMWNTRVACNPSGYHNETDKQFHKFAPMFLEIEKLKL